MNYKEIDLIEYGFEKRPIEELRELLDRIEINGGTHYSVGYKQDDYPYISFFKEEVEETIPITYSILKRKIYWDDLHTLIGVDYYAIKEGYEIKDTEVFDIKVSDAEKYGLI